MAVVKEIVLKRRAERYQEDEARAFGMAALQSLEGLGLGKLKD